MRRSALFDVHCVDPNVAGKRPAENKRRIAFSERNDLFRGQLRQNDFLFGPNAARKSQPGVKESFPFLWGSLPQSIKVVPDVEQPLASLAPIDDGFEVVPDTAPRKTLKPRLELHNEG